MQKKKLIAEALNRIEGMTFDSDYGADNEPTTAEEACSILRRIATELVAHAADIVEAAPMVFGESSDTFKGKSLASCKSQRLRACEEELAQGEHHES